MRLIDADRLTNLLQNNLKDFETMISEYGMGLTHGIKITIDIIAEQPTIDTESLKPK